MILHTNKSNEIPSLNSRFKKRQQYVLNKGIIKFRIQNVIIFFKRRTFFSIKTVFEV